MHVHVFRITGIRPTPNVKAFTRACEPVPPSTRPITVRELAPRDYRINYHDNKQRPSYTCIPVVLKLFGLLRP
jgi:hypothetical protein